MELLSANPTNWSNVCKISFIFTARENLCSQNFQKPVTRKDKYTRNTSFFTRENKCTGKLLRLT